MSFTGALILDEKDNIAVCLEDVEPGSRVEARLGDAVREIVAVDAVRRGHKIAVADIAAGTPILKFGEPIGVASVGILTGQHAHVHNIEGSRGRGDLTRLKTREGR